MRMFNRPKWLIGQFSLVYVDLLLLVGLGLAGLWLLPLPTATTEPQPAVPSALPGTSKRASSALALTPDGTHLLAVNPNSNTVTLLTIGDSPTGVEIPVGDDPRTVAIDDNGRFAYVANRSSHTISVIDLHQGQALSHIPVGHQPYGLVISPDGRFVYVAEQGQGRINVIDTASRTSVRTYPVLDRPSGLALTADGRYLLITHLFHNQITILDLEATAVYLPLITNQQPTANNHQSTVSSEQLAVTFSPAHLVTLWPNSNLLQSVILAPDGNTAVLPHTRSNSGNPALTFDSTLFPVVSLVDVAARQHLVGQQFDLAALDPPAVGLPFDAAFTPDGAHLWVVNAASNDITVIAWHTRQLAAHIEVGDNPRGIAISPDGSTAYVNNTLAGTISVIDTAVYTVTATIPVTTIPLDPTLLQGKRLFHSSADPRMGRDQWMSCNSCHFDGEHDGRTWLLGFAGPRNTPSLLGMGQTLPLRWSGEWDEAADAEFAIRMDSFGTGLVDGKMHCSLNPPDCTNHPPHAGVADDLDALAAYLLSLPPPTTPYPFDEAAQRGQLLFNDLGCAACHPPPLYTDNDFHDVGTVTPGERVGPIFNTPSLRGLAQTPPYFHDGSANTLAAALSRPSPQGEHDVAGQLSAAAFADLIAFLLALPNE